MIWWKEQPATTRPHRLHIYNTYYHHQIEAYLISFDQPCLCIVFVEMGCDILVPLPTGTRQKPPWLPGGRGSMNDEPLPWLDSNSRLLLVIPPPLEGQEVPILLPRITSDEDGRSEQSSSSPARSRSRSLRRFLSSLRLEEEEGEDDGIQGSISSRMSS